MDKFETAQLHHLASQAFSGKPPHSAGDLENGFQVDPQVVRFLAINCQPSYLQPIDDDDDTDLVQYTNDMELCSGDPVPVRVQVLAGTDPADAVRLLRKALFWIEAHPELYTAQRLEEAGKLREDSDAPLPF